MYFLKLLLIDFFQRRKVVHGSTNLLMAFKMVIGQQIKEERHDQNC